jgi:hypothetical protein
MARIHTDRQLLRCIFDMYAANYPSKGDPHVPIDVEAVAKRLRCSPQLLFGRLHFDMGTRLKHRDPSDPRKVLASVFEIQVGEKRHTVNFPYLAAVLADLDEKSRRNAWTLWLSIGAIVVAIASAVVQLLTSPC